ncbi:Proteasome/cyclosome repeat family protein [Reticulomyxa filosa]|uniref:Proteasome/cyclosome repeat family protein n=1 Tax=Reticulomyxa filosa TaxID=46433 RepID=X6P513_RETFI|nr:Proteasome/cyclosome repeat family protein [Reticulomyxa filosa]|eukprot:ETO32677.1 Proteasome/cyclosome repeat family protein [Reticulomyxa filosa]
MATLFTEKKKLTSFLKEEGCTSPLKKNKKYKQVISHIRDDPVIGLLCEYRRFVIKKSEKILTSQNKKKGFEYFVCDCDSNVIESALQALHELITHSWAEIGDRISKMFLFLLIYYLIYLFKKKLIITIIKMKSEELSEKTNEPYAKSASLLASKIFFHLQSYEDALHHALSAGEQFQIDEHSEYVQKLTEQCIDNYRSYAQAQYAFDKGCWFFFF